MFYKASFLICIGVALGAHLQDTPEELRKFFKDIDTQVNALQQATIIRIKNNAVPLESAIEAAASDLGQSLTDAAVPYWATIRSLQETAAERGQDISLCTIDGNNKLFILNYSIVDPANLAFNQFTDWGNDILNASSLEAYSVIQELIVLERVVVQCTNNECATTLRKTVTQYYQRAKNSLDDAEMKTSNYVKVYLPLLLVEYTLDTNLYVSSYTNILDDIRTCVSNL